MSACGKGDGCVPPATKPAMCAISTCSQATGVDLSQGFDGPRYSLYSLALEEAKAGAGVLIGHDCLIGEVVKSGKLIPLFDMPVTTGRVLAIETAPHAHQHSAIRNTVKILQSFATRV